MKRIIPILICTLSALAAGAQTQHPVSDVGISDASFMRSNDRMTVEMNVDLSGLDVKSRQAVLLTPVIVNGFDSVELYTVGIYGRQRWLHCLRDRQVMLGGEDEKYFRDNEAPATLSYRVAVPYAEWMNGSQLVLTRRDYGCRTALVDHQRGPLAEYKSVSYSPEFHYVRPVAEALKTYSLSGRAFIDFPVNRTELYPDYRGNRAELAKIIATIDSVRNDSDITVTSLTIKGFASPEGKYENNIRLAQGRTETLKRYVEQLYSFAPGFIKSDYEPEDWEGLREYVAGSVLPNRSGLLGIIDDTSLDPDTRDLRMKQRYPDDYRVLLEQVYPGLRHSDYSISYTVRNYSTPEEIRAVMATAPQKLTLNEMFVLAQSLEPGSDEYNDVFETAVRMFPDDETANLNAANAAMSRNDYTLAERFLRKAGDSAEAVYARGVLAALQGDYEGALSFMRQAQGLGMAAAPAMVAHLEEVIRYAPAQSRHGPTPSLPK